ncbi:MAG: DUF4434 domain-containing protein, partial [bacterium]
MYPEAYRARSLGLSVAFLDVAHAPAVFSSPTQCEAQIEKLEVLGFDCVIIAEQYNTPDAFFEPSLNSTGNVMQAADSRKINILIVPPHKPYNKKITTAEQFSELSDFIYQNAQEILERYGHYASLLGWVVPYEVNDADLMQEAKREQLGNFFSSITERLRNLKSGGIVLGMGSLSLQNDPIPTKEVWENFLDRASLDVLIIRDGEGTTGNENRSNLDSHLWAAVRATDERSVRLWCAAEAFRIPVEGNGTPNPATYQEILKQMTLLQKYSQRLVAFPATENFLPETANPDQVGAATALYDGYRDWHKNHLSGFSPPVPIGVIQWPQVPLKTIGGSFSQIIGLASYYADPSYVSEELDRMRAVGITLIIPDSTYKDRAYYPSNIIEGREAEGDPLGTILNSAGERNMEVFISLPHFEYRWVWTFLADTSDFLAQVDPVIEELHGLYGDRPAFAGWYIPYELCDSFLGNEAHRRSTAAAFKHMVDTCHRLAPDKPVMISPYFTTDLPDEAFTTIWSDVLALSGIDILAMQDSVGALNVSGTETLRLRYLEHYVHLIADICESTGVQFWWNVETFRQTNGYPLDNRNWAAVTADVERVKRQIAVAALQAQRIIHFDFPHYFSPGYPNRTIAERNKPFYNAYRDWY